MSASAVHIIAADAVAAQSWRNGGGQTRELLTWPASGPWQLRISRADIDKDGPFSAFEGVQRWFCVLEGAGVALDFGASQAAQTAGRPHGSAQQGDVSASPVAQRLGLHTLVVGDAPLHFDGGQAPHCALLDGPTQDLNLMVRQGTGTVVPVHRQASEAQQAVVAPWTPAFQQCGLYTASGGSWSDGQETLFVPAHSLLWCAAVSSSRSRWTFAPASPSPVNRSWWLGFSAMPTRHTPGQQHNSSMWDAAPATPPALTLWRNANFATLTGAEAWGWIERGCMLTQGTTITWVGSQADFDTLAASRNFQATYGRVETTHDLQGALVTPGLVDCHTHLVYGGNRAHEFEMRLQGASYEEIARAGGGIRSTVAATRAASDASLLHSAKKRALALMRSGVTTLEVKSGYGLCEADEARCLRIARNLGEALGITVRTTYLGAHALPPEFAGRAEDYIDAVCDWMPRLHALGLVDAVDAFCENIAFTPAQTRRVFEAAKRLGLPVKLHAEQLSDQGGAALAAEFGALSCDHLEYLSDQGIAAMARAGSVAVLLPGAYYFLRDTHVPPIAALRAAGVPMAIASDHNPGSSPGLSLLLMFNMACTLFRLTPEEALRGATVHAAKALGLSDRGRLAAGLRADFCVWDAQHPNELSYAFGHNPCLRVVVAGKDYPL